MLQIAGGKFVVNRKVQWRSRPDPRLLRSQAASFSTMKIGGRLHGCDVHFSKHESDPGLTV